MDSFSQDRIWLGSSWRQTGPLGLILAKPRLLAALPALDIEGPIVDAKHDGTGSATMEDGKLHVATLWVFNGSLISGSGCM